MVARTLYPPQPIAAVLFDFHSTLVDPGTAHAWLSLAAARLDREVSSVSEETAIRLEFFWERAREVDPDSTRDLDEARHREVFALLAAEIPGLDAELVEALRETLLDTWIAYDDAVPTLQALRDLGVTVVVLSNAGLDIRPILHRVGFTPLVDHLVLSRDVRSVKPHRGIFQAALDRAGVGAGAALMVGDAWTDDGGAAELGIRTLILPRTPMPTHGLAVVPALVEASRAVRGD